jgi:uncharacterized lipoprotein NlpE involved in copper resistance
MTLACGLLLAASGVAHADDPMAGTYGNTVLTKDRASGQSSSLFFNADGSYTGKTMDAKGQPVAYAGTWSLKDDGKTICLAPQMPAGTANPPAPSCSPLEAHKAGDSWSVTNDQKQTFDVSITAGR